jgi:hypothetical protein
VPVPTLLMAKGTGSHIMLVAGIGALDWSSKAKSPIFLAVDLCCPICAKIVRPNVNGTCALFCLGVIALLPTLLASRHPAS